MTTSELLELAQSGNHVSFAYAVSSERAQLAKFGKALFRLRDRKLAGYRVVATRNSRRGSNDYRLVEREAQLFADQEVQ